MMYSPPPQPVYYAGPRYSGCLKFILYLASFFIPLVGLIAAVIFMSRGDPESKSLGQTCLILGIISFVLSCCSGIGVAVLNFGLLEQFGTYY
ncbi:MAG: hypothetical protein P1S60_16935 [Anaerolineae bacterium]|nr:hypothetical protein [Anaerolineae bacterium]